MTLPQGPSLSSSLLSRRGNGSDPVLSSRGGQCWASIWASSLSPSRHLRWVVVLEGAVAGVCQREGLVPRPPGIHPPTGSFCARSPVSLPRQQGPCPQEAALLQEGGPLPGPETGLLSNTQK